MQQYNQVKAKYPGVLLLFRVGDFYETFGEDAIKASGILGIVLTKRANGSASHVELAGFPHHSLDTYLPKLVRAGQRVAICDQLEDPKMTKTIVKRGVTEVVTPGVAYSDHLLRHTSNNYLAALHFGKNATGVAFLDISTGEFLAAEGDNAYIDKLLQSFKPSEVIFQRKKGKDFLQLFGDGFYTYFLDDWVFGEDYAREALLNHFNTHSLKGFGIDGLENCITAAGACLHYIRENQHTTIPHISSLARIAEEKYVWLDRFTIRNLELVSSQAEGAKTLRDVLDDTCTPMGARMLTRWILMPLKGREALEERLRIVEYFCRDEQLRSGLRNCVKQIGDLERLISKIALQKASPREVAQLGRDLQAVDEIIRICRESDYAELRQAGEELDPCKALVEKISRELHPDAPAQLNKGNVIASGVSEELDELRTISHGGKDYLVKLQRAESERTGISSLKVSFNNVFGYYLEVTHAHKDKVPPEWIRKQTLVNAERYITPELKEYEEKILGAEEKIMQLESRLFAELLQGITGFIKPVQKNAGLVSRLDVLLGFACLAIKNNYVVPEITDENLIEISEGRHPVIEQTLDPGEEYIPNDIRLNAEEEQVLIITGPNMAGKSAILRQTGLIVLMSQIGSFVPARRAKIGLVDKIFTRVGASDNLSSGESTFMVEMNETASILNNISERSLILLDEIGRGTSTYDGISIAWSIAEYIHNHPSARARTLFATHYHELNEMAAGLPRVRNYNVSIREVGNKVIFLRKLVPGGSEHSFGIHVARMAGMPQLILERANEILRRLEKERSSGNSLKNGIGRATAKENYQLSMFSLDDPVLISIRDSLRDLDVNSLTPVDALLKLDTICKLLND
ncbi:DNA mismatch repair protein MutS [Anseongella ginsenosidimutans]|uniref:DNA mismatch repair protein MutS n=1 Tax=Anseongella ginsenosidimutans TaxID=496056 RepID=A0A4R3KR44_9SPHI|nr:DNA mismatch repair protein MutS [Anseongella ginsenosidimutans]TCS87380.1 DNA mismatch repair protein MutS [Anseongella ginsenosidimutans]